MKRPPVKYIVIIPISWSFHEGFFKDFPKTFAKKICPVYGHSPPYFYRAHHPRAGVLLPNLSFQNHRCGRTGTLQHGPSGIRHLFCLMRRFHPDGHLPVRCRQCKERPFHLPDRPRHFHVNLFCPGLAHHPVPGFSGRQHPDGTALCTASHLHSRLRPLRRHPCLHQRLLLWYAAYPGSGIRSGD